MAAFWYSMPMVCFSIIRDSEQNDQMSHLKSIWVQKHARAHAQIHFGQVIFEIYPICTEDTHDFQT